MHILRESKPSQKKPAIAEIKQAVRVLDEAKHCFYDSQDKTLLFFYSNADSNKRIAYVAVRLNHTIERFGTDNFVATINKISKDNYEGFIKNRKRYVKMR